MAQTIMIVDKDVTFVENTEKLFVDAGYLVLKATSQSEAEKILESTKPDLLITEIMLENADSGFCLAWKTKKKYSDVIVLIVSAVVWVHHLHFGLESIGERNWIFADAFVNKPIRSEEITNKVKDLLRQKAA